VEFPRVRMEIGGISTGQEGSKEEYYKGSKRVVVRGVRGVRGGVS